MKIRQALAAADPADIPSTALPRNAEKRMLNREGV